MQATFGEYIRKSRIEKTMTLTQLAALLDLDSANLCKIENNQRVFSEKRLDKLAIALKVDFEIIKAEYYSDLIAHKLYLSNSSEAILKLAEKKVNYLKQKNVIQGSLKLL